VAAQDVGWKPLREWLHDRKCEIGAHLHPWVNPPFEAEVSSRNSSPGNLPPALERAKLARLTETIEANFGRRPTVYRAGRYGIGPASGAILEELGYEVDTSVVPFTDFRHDEGPDFTRFDGDPLWLGPNRRVLELPLSVGWCGALRALGPKLQPSLLSPAGIRWHLPGLLARTRLLERIRLTPEGATLAELKRLADTLIAAGKRLFVFSYHSPSLVAGNTPYVRDERELASFLERIDQFCEHFFDRCGGEASTPMAVRTLFAKSERHSADRPLESSPLGSMRAASGHSMTDASRQVIVHDDF